MLLRRIQPLLLLGSGLLLSACGDAGLNVQGVVEVESADGTIRRMEFREETRLDGTGPARFTGSCLLRRTRDAEGHEQWGAIVEIRSGGTVGPGMDASPLTSVTIMQSTASAPAGARVDIELGGVAFTAVEGECYVAVPYVVPDGVVGLSGTCRVVDATNTGATVSLELDLAGCDVEL